MILNASSLSFTILYLWSVPARVFYQYYCALFRQFCSYCCVILPGSSQFVGVTIMYVCAIACLIGSPCVSQVTFCADSILSLRLSPLVCIFCVHFSLFLFPRDGTCFWQGCEHRQVKFCCSLQGYLCRSPVSSMPRYLHVLCLSRLPMFRSDEND